ncbi:NAD(P)/FAD-dependent oxidoreductase [Brevibacillus agri]|uniref:NAD(P)/FAD-dependent oxidoreductase n=1 Tax=Brevibacillus TaxID=55080 RepID=UPI00046ED629|nr:MULTISPECIES: NAD(P)/FAD-dependent oxidoreductase [Brevibacillus]MBG9565018.1 MarR family transcriptional regulator [Brevibacillus agri]MBY0051178.1 NAD(P)/FAD-dependent oxidoreductase [Brevibacillus agri]MCG5250429.1 NAD(P)/FAD-dependent oxidoreductase [Brevibacillus agri]MDN4093182.1 NAD(P)/FAD-dependent oxidoreductase [Brevibacillus agri]MDR9502735.1 NAD(P)/FAD-dependent oxidoreductase [Brevibacillus agri]
MEHVQVLIAGGGIAGLSAAIWCQRLGLSCLLVEKSDRLGGQLHQIHNEIWDFPPRVYPRGASLLDELYQHPTIQNLNVRLGEELLAIDRDAHIVTTSKTAYRVDYLLIATGVTPNEIPALNGCKRVLPPAFSTTAEATSVAGLALAVIGGGDRALESAVNLARHARHVYLLIRSNHLRARPEWLRKIAGLPNLSLLWETEVTGYQDEGERLCLTLASRRPENPPTLAVDWILPRIGVHGNCAGLGGLATFGEGYLKTDEFQRADDSWIYGTGDATNGAAYASLSLAVGQAMKAVKHISMQYRSSTPF